MLNDIAGDIRNAVGLSGWLLHLAGFAGREAQIPAAVKMAALEDPTALRAQLLQWSEIDSPVRVLVSHSSPIVENPRQVLRELAESPP